jgi:hypothetical protein
MVPRAQQEVPWLGDLNATNKQLLFIDRLLSIGDCANVGNPTLTRV